MNRAELSELIKACGKDIYSFCVYLTQSRDQADELYQDTFLTAAESSRKLDISQNPKGWLLSAAVKLWTNKKRKFAGRMRIALSVSEENAGNIPDPSPCPEDGYIEREERQAVISAVRRLPDKQRIPILLFYTEEMSVTEISRTLDIPEGTVKSRLSEARKKLKKYLEADGYGE